TTTSIETQAAATVGNAYKNEPENEWQAARIRRICLPTILFRESKMRYMKLSGLGIMVFAFGAAVLFGQGNQEAANLTREGIEASKVKDWDRSEERRVGKECRSRWSR